MVALKFCDICDKLLSIEDDFVHKQINFKCSLCDVTQPIPRNHPSNVILSVDLNATAQRMEGSTFSHHDRTLARRQGYCFTCKRSEMFCYHHMNESPNDRTIKLVYICSICSKAVLESQFTTTAPTVIESATPQSENPQPFTDDDIDELFEL